MDDLQQDLTGLRALRADAPRPDRARLAAGRARLHQAATGAARERRFRADWRLAAAGVAATLTVAALLAADVVGGGAGGTRVADPAARPGYTATARLGSAADGKDLGDAAKLLRQAADTVEQTPVPTPHDGQWIYTRYVDAGRIDGGPKPRESESWTAYGDPSYSARKEYRLLRSLPDDPERVKKKVRTLEEGRPDTETSAQYDFRLLGGLSQAFPTDPEGRAKVLRAMATLPGITATQVTDNLGRKAVAIGQGMVGRKGFTEFQLLYDPETFAPLGERGIAGYDAEPDADDKDGWKAGDVLSTHALVDQALVDKDGQRP
ncbi:CU044_5270 family protein [Streptomyces sp. NPDC044780]|uniref:CU044_5270 family protein n=1 Tax=unclassified Streptomyces TaxID=2593676 RepID=UPI0033E011B2